MPLSPSSLDTTSAVRGVVRRLAALLAPPMSRMPPGNSFSSMLLPPSRLRFSGTFSSYTVTVSGNAVTLNSAASGSDLAIGIERFQFADLLRTLLVVGLLGSAVIHAAVVPNAATMARTVSGSTSSPASKRLIVG